MNNKLDNYVLMIDNYLASMLSCENEKQVRLIEAMKYSIGAGGKRIRPVLTLEFCRVFGGDVKKALPVACAIEAAHTFSLIHDDLPSMDNDDFRRGKPSCHKQFDEVTALLAGDALAIFPFELISGSELDDSAKVRLVSELSKALGAYGMIGGQQIDTQFENQRLDADELIRMYELKTSRLLQAACCCGAICAGADKAKVEIAREYAKNLGIAFQLVDDVLDVKGDEKELGKPVGSDADNFKNTYAAINGVEKTESAAKEYTFKALETLEHITDNEFLILLTKQLLERKK